ncbi:MAG: radical SAM protein [Candidatus Glassbacteria bacterium]|nr:radical SAM protein [Candidatus Glassbacteria bacterium]
MKGILRLALNGFEYLRKRRKLKSPPMQLSIEPTNICNFRCSFCPQSDPGHRSSRSGKMSPESCRSILERAARDFYPDPVHRKVSFTHDGEPLVNGRFREFLEAASDLEYIIKFASNGYLVKREFVDSLVSSRIKFNICVDFTSDRMIFEKFRGFAGSYQVVFQNLRYLMEKAGETGLIFVDVCDISPYYIREPGRVEARFAEMQELFGGLGSPGVRFHRRIFHSMAGTVELPGRDRLDRSKYRLCPYPWFNLNVTWNGDVVPCCRDLTPKTLLGNVLEVDSLWEIWNSAEYVSLREALAEGEPQRIDACRECELPYESSRWTFRYLLKTVRSRLLRSGRK